MSVYKSKRGESPMQFVQTAWELEDHTFTCLLKVPKRYTFLLSTHIMNLAREVYDCVNAANNIWPTNEKEVQDRRDLLTRANNALQNMDRRIDTLYRQIKKNPQGYEWIDNAVKRWAILMADEARLISAVKKADRQRYKNMQKENEEIQ